MLPPLTKGVLIVEQTELLNDVVHDQVDVDYRLTSNVLLVGIAQLAHHVNGEPLVGIELEHALDDASQLGRVLIVQRRELTLRNTLEEIIKRQVLLVVLAKGTSQHTELISYAPHAPHITLPVVSLALKYFWAHV